MYIVGGTFWRGGEALENTKALIGGRRDLTKELFEELGALQCEPEEILGYVGTTAEKLDRWCRRVYRRPLAEILPMIRQDGLIEIRRASFDALRRSAPLIQQQYNRFLSGPAPDREKAAEQTARQVFHLLTPDRETVEELFEE